MDESEIMGDVTKMGREDSRDTRAGVAVGVVDASAKSYADHEVARGHGVERIRERRSCWCRP